ncbi:hypothetical protein ACFL59_02970 [Planctomycetota bacterium]
MAVSCALVLGFAMGFAAGRALASKNATTSVRPSPEQRPVREQVSVAPLERPSGQAVAPGQQRAEAVQTQHPGPAGVLAEAVAAVPEEEYGPREGTIGGRVLDTAGMAVLGVLVEAVPADNGRWDRRGDVRSGKLALDTFWRAEVREHRFHQAMRTATRTGTDGAFVLTELGETEYKVRATLAGYRIEAEPGSGHDVVPGPDARAVFLAHKVLRLPVDIRWSTGEQPDRATIQVRGESGTDSLQWHREDPAVVLDPGTYSLRPSVGGLYLCPRQKVNLTPKQTPAPLQFVLRQRPEIRGTVVSRSRQPGVNASSLRWVSLASDTTPEVELLERSGKVAELKSDGGIQRFRIRNLAPGLYLLGARGLDGKVWSTQVVELADESVDVELEIEVPPPVRERILVLRALDPEGRPIAEVDIDASYHLREETTRSSCRVIDHREGSYSLLMDEWFLEVAQGHREGRYSLKLRTLLYGTKIVSVTPGKQREIKIRFQLPATLKVTVAGHSGSTHEGAVRLALVSEEGGHAPQDQDSWDEPGLSAGGIDRFGPVAPGEYELYVLVGSGYLDTLPVMAVPIQLGPGRNETVLDLATLPPLYTLTVSFEHEPNKDEVYLGKTGGHKELQMPKRGILENGYVIFDRLPAGDYLLLSRRGGQCVTVSADSEIHFDPDPKVTGPKW